MLCQSVLLTLLAGRQYGLHKEVEERANILERTTGRLKCWKGGVPIIESYKILEKTTVNVLICVKMGQNTQVQYLGWSVWG